MGKKRYLSYTAHSVDQTSGFQHIRYPPQESLLYVAKNSGYIESCFSTDY